ncbi:MAG: FAD-binding domain-containing protein [Opitutales bacterium]
MYVPTKAAARKAMDAFLPHAGRDYAAGRNYDNGPGKSSTVSRLSPWIRNRVLPEWELLEAVLERHSPSAASKFIDEVCWRTYWKGWLQLRPGIWQDYLGASRTLLNEYDKHVGYTKAIEGRTGIDCFDAWNAELIETNYLHNHARMWFASVWVHSLKLPWQLGADWFLRHLLDGDPASNTLSWRWVAGLHTRGKSYLARPDNIRKYTNGRFRVDVALAKETIELDEPEIPQPCALESILPVASGQRLGLLVTDEDLSADEWIREQNEVVAQAGFFPQTVYEQLQIAEPVIRFRRESVNQLGTLAEDVKGILAWADERDLEGIIMAKPAVGPTADSLARLGESLKADGRVLYTVRHWWDDTLYPHATHGFFLYKKAIPGAIAKIQECTSISHLDDLKTSRELHRPSEQNPSTEKPPHGAGSFHELEHHQILMERMDELMEEERNQR